MLNDFCIDLYKLHNFWCERFGKPFEYAKFSVPEYHFGTNIIHYIFFLEKHLENFGRTLCSLNKVSRPENHLKTWCIWMVLIFGYFIKYFMYLIHIQIGKTLGEHYVPWTRFLDWKTLVNLNVFKGYQNLLNLLNTLCIYVISQVYSQVGNNPLFPVSGRNTEAESETTSWIIKRINLQILLYDYCALRVNVKIKIRVKLE